MTTLITAGTLKVTITEEMTVMADAQGTGRDPDTTNYFTIAAVATIARRLVSIPTTETGLLAFAADLLTAPAATEAATSVAGHYDQDNVRYIRITNKDDTNFVTLRFRATDGAEFGAKLDKGQTFIYTCDDAAGTVATMDADTAATTIVLQDLEDVTALADTASCDLEVFVASV